MTIQIAREETRCRHIGSSFRLTTRWVFYIHHPTDRIAHTMAIVTPVVEHWLEREIVQWVHPMKDRSDDPSHHERTLLPRSYISLRPKLFSSDHAPHKVGPDCIHYIDTINMYLSTFAQRSIHIHTRISLILVKLIVMVTISHLVNNTIVETQFVIE